MVVRASSRPTARRIQLRYSQLSLAFRISLERRIRLRELGYSGAGFRELRPECPQGDSASVKSTPNRNEEE